MTKLNSRKIRWIMGELERGQTSIRQIAKVQKVTPRRVRQLREHLRCTGQEFRLKTERKFCRRMVLPTERKLIIEARKRHRLGSTMLEKILELEYGEHIPHNVIQRVLRENGFAMPLNKKVKRRDWVRYERKHSNSMWHTDWTVLEGKWLIAFQDDASRLIVAYGLFDDATSENSVEVLKQAILAYGKPREILTGRDCQFYASDKNGQPAGNKTVFQQFLAENGIKHVVGRVNHPQTNGKIERWFGEVKRKLHEFEDLDEMVKWYNEIKPHMSLDFERLETPIQAFRRKLHHKSIEKKELVLLEASE